MFNNFIRPFMSLTCILFVSIEFAKMQGHIDFERIELTLQKSNGLRKSQIHLIKIEWALQI